MSEHTKKSTGELPIETDFRLKQERAFAPKKETTASPSESSEAPTKPTRRRRDSAKLVWDSKPRRAPNPKDIEFQTAEVVIPNPATAGELPLSFRDGVMGEAELQKQKMNRLIWGDNLLAMQALLANGYEGKINLIYVDPPFDTNEDYYYRMNVGEQEFEKAPSILERLAYRDRWEAGIDSYLDELYPRLHLMRRLLSNRGSIVVHVGVQVSSYVRIVLDEIFGRHCFQNEIIWQRTDPHNDAVNKFGNIHDVLYWFGKSPKPNYYPDAFKDELTGAALKEYGLLELPDGRVVNYAGNEEAQGRRFKLENGTWKGTRNRFAWRGAFPSRNREWRWSSSEEMDTALERGEIYLRDPKKGSARCLKLPLPDNPGILLQDIWLKSGRMKGGSVFPTQKPEQLLEQIIQTMTQPEDLVADFYSGAGTTAVVAERLGRFWIGGDFGKVAIQVARARLVQDRAKPFLIENIGNYQREMIYLSGGRIGEIQRIILKLYGATPHPHHRDLGTKQVENSQHELVFVGYPDRPVTARKVEELARLAEKLDGSGYKRLAVLGWDYDYNYSTELDNRLKHAKPPIKTIVESRTIPPEIYDYLKKARDETDVDKLAAKIHFHEKPYLKLSPPKIRRVENGVQISVSIERYVLFDFPVEKDEQREELLRLVKENFVVLIDYWAVDWDYDGATFKSAWQAIRGNERKIYIVPVEATQTLPKGKRTIAVRVVDVFGNDASATLEVEGK